MKASPGLRAAVGFPVVFDDRWFEADLHRASPKGKDVAGAAREQFERDGVDSDLLFACQDPGPDGTRLPGCVKTYLGPGTGRGPGHWEWCSWPLEPRAVRSSFSS
jgi:hypothetical protein